MGVIQQAFMGHGGLLAPVNTVAPWLNSPAATVGTAITCYTGTWSGNPSFTYQWKRAGANISGATTNTYTCLLSDVGIAIRCDVTATNSAGSSIASSDNGYTTYTQLFDDAFISTHYEGGGNYVYEVPKPVSARFLTMTCIGRGQGGYYTGTYPENLWCYGGGSGARSTTYNQSVTGSAVKLVMALNYYHAVHVADIAVCRAATASSQAGATISPYGIGSSMLAGRDGVRYDQVRCSGGSVPGGYPGGAGGSWSSMTAGSSYGGGGAVWLESPEAITSSGAGGCFLLTWS